MGDKGIESLVNIHPYSRPEGKSTFCLNMAATLAYIGDSGFDSGGGLLFDNVSGSRESVTWLASSLSATAHDVSWFLRRHRISFLHSGFGRKFI
jgi:hypothetical protein